MKTKDHMNKSKKLRALVLHIFLFGALNTYAQCVDSTLIDLNAICPLIYAPVCGCNGVTYDNECYAISYGGVTQWTDGACVLPLCEDVSGVDFGPCDFVLGIGWNGSACVTMSGCGYIVDDVDYSPFFYETETECLGACDNALYNCINQWQLEQGELVDCTGELASVCGCDQVTYQNSCVAFYNGGVTTYSIGACSDTTCLRIPSFVDFGSCEMPLGWALLESGCEFISGCSYIGQNGYDYSNYFFESSYQCGGQCIGSVVIECVDSTLIDLNALCVQIYDPVCGCDDITYYNSCAAINYGGVTSWVPGECVNSVKGYFRDNMILYPNPAQSEVNITFNQARSGMIAILDISGKIVSESKINAQRTILIIDNLAAGAYLIKYSGNDGNIAFSRLMKE